jgi:CheY-like chemotaxis protein
VAERGLRLELAVKKAHSAQAELSDALQAIRSAHAEALRARENEVAAIATELAQSMVLGYLDHQLRNPLHSLVAVREALADPSTSIPLEQHVEELSGAIAQLHRVCDIAAEQGTALEYARRVNLRPTDTLHLLRELHIALGSLNDTVLPIISATADVPQLVTTDRMLVSSIFVSVARWLLRGRREPSTWARLTVKASTLAAPSASAARLQSADGIVVSPLWLSTCRHATATAEVSTADDGHPRAEGDWAAASRPPITEQQPSAWSWWLHLEMFMDNTDLSGKDPQSLFVPSKITSGARHVVTDLDLPVARMLAVVCGARIGLFDSSTITSDRAVCFMLDLPLHSVAVRRDGFPWPLVLEGGTRFASAGTQQLHSTSTSPASSLVTPSLGTFLASPSASGAASDTGGVGGAVGDPSVAVVTPVTPSVSSDAARRLPPLALVVEDEAVNRRINARLMGKLGFDVRLAADGTDVVPAVIEAEMSGRPFDVVVTDIVMPGESGDVVCTKLRKLGRKNCELRSRPLECPYPFEF